MAEPYMTMAEIEAKYPNEWVLVAQLKKRGDGFAVGGVVIAHGEDKEAVLAVVDSLPKSASGKVLKREVRDRYWQGAERRVG